MKSTALFTVLLFCLLQSFAINKPARDTIPNNIKNYSKEQFLKEFGKDETSQKLIRYYFYRSKNAKQSLYIFPALTTLSLIYGIGISTGTGGGYAVLVSTGAFLFAIGFLIISIEACVNRKKYSPQKLHEQLLNYQAGNPLPKKLKRQIKYFTRQ